MKSGKCVDVHQFQLYYFELKSAKANFDAELKASEKAIKIGTRSFGYISGTDLVHKREIMCFVENKKK